MMESRSIWSLALALLVLVLPARLTCQDVDALSRVDPARDNIVVVLDASGSMRELMPGSDRTRMNVAKDALLRVLATVPPTTNVGVLVFSGKNTGQGLLHPLEPIDRDSVRAAITRIGAAGGTPLGAFLKTGTDMLLEKRKEQRGYGTFRLLVVTDGEASDAKLVDRYLPDILSRGVTVDVVGVAMASDHQLATRVHSYRRANDSEALVEVLTEVFAEVGGAQDDATDAEAFDIVAAIPAETAAAMLSALSAQGDLDEPVGRSLAASAVVPDAGEGSGRAGSSPPTHAPQGRTPPGGDAGGGGAADRDGGPPWVVLVFFVVIFIVFVTKKKGRRRGRRTRRH